MFKRQLTGQLQNSLNSGKIILLIGPRQVGKTTLIKEILKEMDYLFVNGDDPIARNLLSNANTETIRNLIGSRKILFIDEAQRIENIGLTLKIIHDQFPEIVVVVSGSSAFELNNLAAESLTGRKNTNHLYPISWKELEESDGFLTAVQQTDMRLIFGMYPEVMNKPGEERNILTELYESYLFKDILSYSGIRKPEVLQKILKALAFQMGSEVSLNEIAQLVGVDKNTVNSYITLLEQAYVIFPLTSFSRNLRNEIKTNVKYCFFDNGIRNAVLQNFSPIYDRQDRGALWENYLISERFKQNDYQRNYRKMYFWRTVSQQEIYLIEEVDGKIIAHEFKWKEKSSYKTPKAFLDSYMVEAKQIHKENFYDFIKGN